eukprot:gene9562-1765_t
MSDVEEKRKRVEQEILAAKKRGEESKIMKNIPTPEEAQRIFRSSFNELSEMQKSVLKSTEKCFKICQRRAMILDIRGVKVAFPYEPYPVQKAYMTKVIQSLQEGKNALLESPTGTGKTLSLLCATLAWTEHMKTQKSTIEVPKIIYASRTHSQLTQVVRELKKSAYEPQTTILGSREQFCVHPSVATSKGTELNSKCSLVRKQKKCEYYENFSNHRKDVLTSFSGEIQDIEDLIKVGRDTKVCPFYVTRSMQAASEIIFMPYNYLIDPVLRNKMNITIEGSILIFDESHNLEKWCTEAASFDLKQTTIINCIAELYKALLMLEDDETNEFNIENVSKLRSDILEIVENLLNLEKKLKDISMSTEELVKDGDFVLDLFDKVNFSKDYLSSNQNTIKQCIDIITSEKQKEFNVLIPPSLHDLEKYLTLIFSQEEEEEEIVNVTDTKKGNTFLDHYKCIIKKDSNSKISKPKQTHYKDAGGTEEISDCKLISFWCLSPSIAIKSIKEKKPKCFILTSGTISPMDSYAFEMDMYFPVRLENPHVIQSNQISCVVARKGSNGVHFNSSFKNRDSAQYQKELGTFIANISKVIPDGILVFFPSYVVMSNLVVNWKRVKFDSKSENTIWSEIEKKKKIFTEPKESSMLQRSMREYEEEIEKSSGAIYFAVCRGKASEGIDFSNRYGRAVIITGLPFPPHHDKKIELKMNYLSAIKKNTPNAISGNDWYDQQASRAVNQAIGRVLRNRYDYGAIILADERFAETKYRELLSKWIQPHVKVSDSFNSISKHFTKFFNHATENFGINSEKLSGIPFEKESKTIKKESNNSSLVNIHRISTTDRKKNDFFSFSNSQIESEPKITPTTKPLIPIGPLKSKITVIEEHKHKTPTKPLIPVGMPKSKPLIPVGSVHKKKEIVKINEIQKKPPTIETPKLMSSIKNQTKNAPTTPTTQNKTAQFVSKVKNNIPKSEYQKFKNIIFKLSKEDIKFDDFMSEIKKIFLQSGSMKNELYFGLKDVLPKKYDDEFQKYLEIETSKKRAQHNDLFDGSKKRKVAPQETKIINLEDDEKKKEEKKDTSLKCLICLDIAVKPHNSRCGHVCCFECWDSWLNRKLECPICKQRVRKNQLTPIYSN